MRAINVIIVSSGASPLAAPDVLDKLIRLICANRKRAILVLGPDGDDILANCSEIENCELVFDPNYAGGFFSGVKAGLHATHGAAFVVPLHASAIAGFADSELEFSTALATLENSVEGDGTAAQCDVVCPSVTHADARLARSETIFLVTQKGVSSLKEIPAQTDWETFEQICIEHVAL